MKPVTDPALLEQLETPVDDPELLRQLEGEVTAPVTEVPADPTGNWWQNLTAGVGKGLTDLGRGAQQTLLQFPGYTGPAVTKRRQELEQEEAESRRLGAPLEATTAGKIGKLVGMAAPSVLAAPFAPTLAGSALIGGATGAAMPRVQGESALPNAALGAAGGAAGHKAGQLLQTGAQKVAGAMAARAAAKATPQQQAARQAVQAGFKLPPSQINHSLTNRILEGTAGKITTAQHAAKANQPVTQNLAAKALGIKEVTPANVAQVRQAAGAVYETLKQQAPFQVDDAFRAQLAQVNQAARAAAGEIPELADDAAEKLLQGLAGKQQFSAPAAVEATRILRHRASLNFKAVARGTGGPQQEALAHAERAAANAIEELMERNLSATNPGLVPQFRAARALIAKAHSVEDAMNPATGIVNAADLGKMVDKGAPLTGELATVGKTALAFPKATQDVSGQSILPISPLDMTNAGIWGTLGMMTQNPLLAVPAIARPGIRAAILSRPYQLLTASPKSAVLPPAARVARALLPGAGAAGSTNLQK